MSSSTITLRSIVDRLEGFELVKQDTCPSIYISWCIFPPSYNSQIYTKSFIQDEVLLLVDNENTLKESLERFPNSPILFISNDSEISLDINFESIGSRLCIIAKNEKGSSKTLSDILISIQFYILETKEWLSSLEQIIEENGNMQDLLDASEHIFKDYMDVSDSSYRLIANTKHYMPTGHLSQNLLNIGRHETQTLDNAVAKKLLEQWDKQHGVRVFKPDEDTPDPFMTKVLKNGNSYGGHLVLICHNNPVTQGTVDLFKGLANACQLLLNKQQIINSSSYSTLLLSLLCNPHSFIENETEYSSLKNKETFSYQIITFNNVNSEYISQPGLLNKMITDIFNSDIVMTSHNGNLICLLTDKSQHIYYDTKYYEQLEAFCTKTKFTVNVSNPFDNLYDTHLAYKQTILINKYKPLLLHCYKIKEKSRLTLFSDVLSYFFIDTHEDRDLFTFCNKYSVIDQMLTDEKNKVSDISDVCLLYYYLLTERRISECSAILHMHRNTLTKRIDKLSKNYHLDLDKFEIRNQLITLYNKKLVSLPEFKNCLTINKDFPETN